jgi:hypothetical protein
VALKIAFFFTVVLLRESSRLSHVVDGQHHQASSGGSLDATLSYTSFPSLFKASFYPFASSGSAPVLHPSPRVIDVVEARLFIQYILP